MGDPIRVGVVGGGLAGALLTWRLTRYPWVEAHLVLGHDGALDATEASGGAVRAYDPVPAQCALATASLLELLGSRVLQNWSGYRQSGFTYIRTVDATVALDAAEIRRWWPGAVDVVAGPDLARRGFLGLPSGTCAVIERYGGYLAPDRLRHAVLAALPDGAARTGAVSTIEPRPDGSLTTVVDGEPAVYDVVVVAAGGWTPSLLRAAGFAADGYRTKAIQYGIYPVESLDGMSVPAFADETTGLYAKPTVERDLLLGYPTGEWGVPPGRPPVDPDVHAAAVALLRERVPALRVGPARRYVSATDCYTDPPVLDLRPVPGGGDRLFTFTGGSGGAAKTALAASTRAAAALSGARTTAGAEDQP